MHSKINASFNYSQLLLILILIFMDSRANADPYYCKTGTNCLAANVTGPLVICEGESIDLYARTSGFVWPLPPPCSNATFQWYRERDLGGWVDYVAITGATDKKYVVSTAGRYYCEVGCTEGGYSTSLATIMVNPQETNLIVSVHPQPQSPCLGSQADFEVGASG